MRKCANAAPFPHFFSLLLVYGLPPAVVFGRDTEGEESMDSRTTDRDKDSYRDSTELPVWPTELPNVFNFSDSYFNLQNDLNCCVLQYLTKMGYADAASQFRKEYVDNRSIGSTEVSTIDADADSDIDDLFDTGVDYSDLKIEQCSLGSNNVDLRKKITIWIINGNIEECIRYVNFHIPLFFEIYFKVKIKLLNLQAIEKIRLFSEKYKEFKISSNSKEVEKEMEREEYQFLNSFIAFVKEELSDPLILKYPDLVKDLENTMGLLTVYKNEEDLPMQYQGLLNLQLREDVAMMVSKYLQCYLDGVTLDSDLITVHESSQQHIDNDTSNGTGNDTRLYELVKLFVWSSSQ